MLSSFRQSQQQYQQLMQGLQVRHARTCARCLSINCGRRFWGTLRAEAT